ncbi:GGDEF domain-containing protein [Catenuloplanes japonicus]|uniref:GGDEF domain-containing protein n=1 Tax=Catenuloplanes japonicus TaxID=33876 RepID=UPI000525D544|nr:GGDEF domain-containing protein [Catenuloplanes japonicus]
MPILVVAAIGLGIRLNRPARRLPWVLLLVAAVLGLLGGAAVVLDLTWRGELTFPSLADAFWLACYPVQVAASMLLVNGLSWRRDLAGILDTLMVAGALGLGVWLFFVRDLIDPGMPLDTRLITLAYPLADLLLLACLVRMLVSSARRNPAFWQFIAFCAAQSLGHAVWVWQAAHDVPNGAVAASIILAETMLGGAALHPSMAALQADGAGPAVRVGLGRTVLIGSACLLCPALQIADGLLTDGDVDWLAASVCSMAVFGLVIVRMVGLIRIVQDQADRLESIAYLDGLTGIPNRRAWDLELERRLAAARRTGGTLVVALIDIDYFKRYNDLRGHQAGDVLLCAAATAWQRQLRAADLIARYGGEEFGLILDGELRDAVVVVERLRDVTPEGQTFSAGLAVWDGGDESAEQVTARADAGLYVAKRDGRDRYTVAARAEESDLITDGVT